MKPNIDNLIFTIISAISFADIYEYELFNRGQFALCQFLPKVFHCVYNFFDFVFNNLMAWIAIKIVLEKIL